jgi:MbtH protein
VADGERPGRRYTVVVNHEGQHSIWPEAEQPPAGWSTAGRSGDEAACLAYISEVWTDLRPLSARGGSAEERTLHEAAREGG